MTVKHLDNIIRLPDPTHVIYVIKKRLKRMKIWKERINRYIKIGNIGEERTWRICNKNEKEKKESMKEGKDINIRCKEKNADRKRERKCNKCRYNIKKWKQVQNF